MKSLVVYGEIRATSPCNSDALRVSRGYMTKSKASKRISKDTFSLGLEY